MIVGNSLDVFQMILSSGEIISFSAPTIDCAMDLAKHLLPAITDQIVVVAKDDTVSYGLPN
jgi:hypothetical protein